MIGALVLYCLWGGRMEKFPSWFEIHHSPCGVAMTASDLPVIEDKVDQVIEKRLSAAGLVGERKKKNMSSISHHPSSTLEFCIKILLRNLP